jgi:type I restriction enzyme S subunit
MSDTADTFPAKSNVKRVALADLTRKITKGTTPTTVGGRFAERGINFLKVESITEDGTLDSERIAQIDEESHELLRRSQLEKDDVLFSIAGAIGRTYLVSSDDLPANVNQALAIVRFDSDKMAPKFGYYAMRSREFQGDAFGRVVQTAQANVNLTQLAESAISSPPLAIQQRIADVLSAYDGSIENNRRRMGLLERAVRLLYEEWFVRLRFPGHEHTPIIRGLPQGWRSATLDSITSKIGSGATPRGGEAAYQRQGVTLIRSLNVYDDRFEDAGLAFISDEQAADLDNVTVQSRDILLNITGASVARCCMTPNRYLPARVNQHVMIIRVDSAKTDPFFVHAAINSDERKRQLLSYAQKGSTREALTKETVGAFEITLPTDSLARQFGEVARTCFLQRENLAQQNQKLRAVRDLLLPRLMSGEIEV